MAILKQFCWCCALETGGMILGWLGAAGDILSIILISIMFSYKEFMNSSFFAIVEVAGGISLGIYIIHLMSSICLIIGVTQRSSVLILPWIITHFFHIVGCGMLLTMIFKAVPYGFHTIQYAGNEMIFYENTQFPFGFLFLTIMIELLLIYFWICAISLYQTLRSESLQQRNHNTNSNLTTHFFKQEVPLPPYTLQPC